MNTQKLYYLNNNFAIHAFLKIKFVNLGGKIEIFFKVRPIEGQNILVWPVCYAYV